MQKIRNIQCKVDEKNEEKDHFGPFWGVNLLNPGLRIFPAYRPIPKIGVLYYATFGKILAKFNVAFMTIFGFYSHD